MEITLMDKQQLDILKKENNNLLAVMLYIYEDKKFLQTNIKFMRECLDEWYSTYKITKK